MQIKIFAAVIITIISLATFHMANADSPIQSNSKHNAMNSMIADGLRLANQSSNFAAVLTIRYS
jgi:hypothetical protein